MYKTLRLCKSIKKKVNKYIPLAVANQINQLPAPAPWIRGMQRNSVDS